MKNMSLGQTQLFLDAPGKYWFRFWEDSKNDQYSLKC